MRAKVKGAPGALGLLVLAPEPAVKPEGHREPAEELKLGRGAGAAMASRHLPPELVAQHPAIPGAGGHGRVWSERRVARIVRQCGAERCPPFRKVYPCNLLRGGPARGAAEVRTRHRLRHAVSGCVPRCPPQTREKTVRQAGLPVPSLALKILAWWRRAVYFLSFSRADTHLSPWNLAVCAGVRVPADFHVTSTHLSENTPLFWVTVRALATRVKPTVHR